MITITDNGSGIQEDDRDKIFIPFYTTNPEGTGIGQSLSRQILRMPGATVTAHSVPNHETTFTIGF